MNNKCTQNTLTSNINKHFEPYLKQKHLNKPILKHPHKLRNKKRHLPPPLPNFENKTRHVDGKSGKEGPRFHLYFRCLVGSAPEEFIHRDNETRDYGCHILRLTAALDVFHVCVFL